MLISDGIASWELDRSWHIPQNSLPLTKLVRATDVVPSTGQKLPLTKSLICNWLIRKCSLQPPGFGWKSFITALHQAEISESIRFIRLVRKQSKEGYAVSLKLGWGERIRLETATFHYGVEKNSNSRAIEYSGWKSATVLLQMPLLTLKNWERSCNNTKYFLNLHGNTTAVKKKM